MARAAPSTWHRERLNLVLAEALVGSDVRAAAGADAALPSLRGRLDGQNVVSPLATRG